MKWKGKWDAPPFYKATRLFECELLAECVSHQPSQIILIHFCVCHAHIFYTAMEEEQRETGKAGSLVFAVNGQRFEVSSRVDPSTTLLEFLRTRTSFKSVKLGCGEGIVCPFFFQYCTWLYVCIPYLVCDRHRVIYELFLSVKL